MFESLKGRVLSVLRVPPEPEPPAGAPGSLARFRAAPSYLQYQLALWGLKQLGALAGLIVGLSFLAAADFADLPGAPIFRLFEILGVAAFAVQLPLSLLVVRLDYEQRWYLVTDRSLRIRHGVLRVEEKTQSFANIQNLAIRQGPIQRLLGISDLEVHTAGGGEARQGRSKARDQARGEDLHTATFHGVDNAEQIRDGILARLRRLRDSGLGDPEEAPSGRSPEIAAETPELAELRGAVGELLAAARALPSTAPFGR
jgi:membrane protein YdbS with pleckstrin-like domain